MSFDIWETGVNNDGNGTDNNQYYISDTSSLIKRLTIQRGTGTVGIDTNTPISIMGANVKLDVNGSINLTENIYKNGQPYVSNSTTWIENETKTKIYYMSGNVGINTDDPMELLDVNGTIKSTNIIANGSGLTNLNASEIATENINTYRLPETISVSAFIGSGVNLTNLNANNLNITSGKINNSVLPSTIEVLSLEGDGQGLNNLDASKFTSGNINNIRLPTNISVSTLTGSGAGITNLQANNISGKIHNDILPTNISVTSLTGIGSNITELNASEIKTGKITSSVFLPDNINVNYLSGNGYAISNLDASKITQGKLNNNLFNNDISITGKLTVNNLSVSGTSAIINSENYNTENLEIINNNASEPSLIINHNSTFNDLMRILSNNTRIFTILKDGNVGIGGTLVPNSIYKLNVDGNINSSSTISSDIVLIRDSINFYKSSTQSILIKIPQTLLSSYTITLPNAGPSANNILKSDSSGNLSWVNINESPTLENVYSFFNNTEFEKTTSNIRLKNINSSKLISTFNSSQFEKLENSQTIRIRDNILTAVGNVSITSINNPPSVSVNTLNIVDTTLTNSKEPTTTPSVPKQIPTDKYLYYTYTHNQSGNPYDGSTITAQTFTAIFTEPVIADILVVAGGGGGGNFGGGGGGGDVLYFSGVSLNGSYQIKVGNGGKGTGTRGHATHGGGWNGENSSIIGNGLNIVAGGGGGGGGYSVSALAGTLVSFTDPNTGTSKNSSGGGGGSILDNTSASGNSVSGDGATNLGSIDSGGGGGGSGGMVDGFLGTAPQKTAANVGGNGGIGYQTDISGTLKQYGGGGGGGDWTGNPGIPGIGTYGGGNGSLAYKLPTAGTPHTGGGGGGGGGGAGGEGARGGSGIVIIRYYVVSSITHKYLALTNLNNPYPVLTADSTNLVAWYKFDGNFNDSSGNGHHLTAVNTTISSTNSLIYDSANFSGQDDYLEFPSSINPYTIWNGNGISFTMWVKITSSGSWSRFIDFQSSTTSGSSGFLISKMDTSNNIRIEINSIRYVITPSVNVFDGIWHHLVFTCSSSGVWSAYVDGTNQNISYTQNIPNLTYVARYINKSTYSSDGKFDGQMDGFRIYNKVLSASEVSTLYTNINIPTTYQVNFPVNTTCDILTINNSQYIKTSGVILNGSYNVVVGSTSKIQQNSTDLYVPNTNLNITDSITGSSITYTANSPNVIIRYSMFFNTNVEIENIIPKGYLKFDNNSWNVEYSSILTSKVLHNEICMTRYLSSNNYSMINIYEYSVINILGVSSSWITINNEDIIYIAKSGYTGAYPTYQNNFVGNILKIRLKSCSLENVYKSFLIDHNSYTHKINCTIKNIASNAILYNSQDININNTTFFNSPELFTNGINLSTNSIPTNVKHLLELKLFVSFDASTNSTTTIKQQTDKFYLFYENF